MYPSPVWFFAKIAMDSTKAATTDARRAGVTVKFGKGSERHHNHSHLALVEHTLAWPLLI